MLDENASNLTNNDLSSTSLNLGDGVSLCKGRNICNITKSTICVNSNTSILTPKLFDNALLSSDDVVSDLSMANLSEFNITVNTISSPNALFSDLAGHGQSGELYTFTFIAFILILSSYIVNAMTINTYFPKSSGAESNIHPDDAMNILREIRVKNVNRVIIGSLNINSLPPKFEQLKLIIGNSLDVLVILETKLDSSFPSEQFVINGYKKPYRLDRKRNGRNGGG